MTNVVIRAVVAPSGVAAARRRRVGTRAAPGGYGRMVGPAAVRYGMALWCVAVFVGARAGATEPVDFNRQIRPLLAENCFPCHGPDAQARQADLRLDLEQQAVGDDGAYVIVRGRPAESRLLERVASRDPGERMPPADFNKRLDAAEIELLRRWVAEGARYARHWSFVPVSRPALPRVENAAWVSNPIDTFVLAQQEARGLQPAGRASHERLLRRVTLDLTGLPPTLGELDRFRADLSPGAYERAVDRLLASHRAGEHLAWRWLDAARYSDTNGYQGDRTRTMWFWRDWVVRAYNENMPFDRFSIEQLARDLLPHASVSQRIATGFNRNHPLNGEGGRIAEENRVEYVFDRTETTATVWMGLTLGCARCHDHKYDPLTQKDYYRFFAFFNSVAESGRVDRGGNAEPVLQVPTPAQAYERRRLVAAIDRQQAIVDAPLEQFAEARRAWAARMREQLVDETAAEGWHVLRPRQSTSAGGATLAVEPDGSVLVRGKSGPRDDYLLEFELGDVRLTALRLEARTHPRLKDYGPGREGEFILTAFEAELVDAGGQGGPLAFARAEADYSHPEFAVGGALDGDAETGWSISSGPVQSHRDRSAMFVFEAPVEARDGATLKVRLRHQHARDGRVLGCFRVALTSDASPSLQAPQAPSPRVRAALASDEASLGEADRALIAHFHRRTMDSYRAAAESLREHEVRLARLREQMPFTMVMRQLDEPRETHLLRVGRYDQPDRSESLAPALPSVLPSLPTPVRDRLDMARWLVDAGHPLTARVAVNHMWQALFGVGLVPTSEDFGSQGAMPTHPRLLDWLAAELVDSGWNVKHLLRLMVTSATYGQQARGSAAAHRQDPGNVWLARAPRYRLPAHVLRDQALALSGLLVEQVGGPSVKPYQPPGLWADFSFGKIRYEQDHGARLYRRSLYTFWRRSLGPPNMFDAADRQVCTVRSRRTNTPLHALTLLNDVTFSEASRVFAERVLAGAATDRERLARAFRAATARMPREDEQVVLRRALDRARTHYAAHPDDAGARLETGEYPASRRWPVAELAAYADVMTLILNLDEVMSKE